VHNGILKNKECSKWVIEKKELRNYIKTKKISMENNFDENKKKKYFILFVSPKNLIIMNTKLVFYKM